MKKLNILVVIDNIFPSAGGMGRSTERFSKMLSNRGHNVVVVTGNDKKGDFFEVIDKIKVHRLKGFKLPFSNNMYHIPYPSKNKLVKIIGDEKIDVILLVSYTFMAYIINKLSKELNVPILYGSHIQPENVTRPVHFDNFFSRKIMSLWIKKVCQIAEEVMTPSNFSKNMLVSFGVKKRINVISNGIDLKVFNPSKVSDILFRDKFNLNGKRIFLYSGRLMPEKNVSLLIRAISYIDFGNKKNQDLRFVIMGGGRDKDKLVKMAKSLGVYERIIFSGSLSGDVLLSAYKSASILVHPSLYETEGMVVLEAMAFGKPILIANSDKSASRNFVKKGYNGYVFNPYDPEVLAKKMISMINGRNKLKIMGKNSLKFAREFDIEKSTDKLESLLIRVSNKK